MKNTYKAIILAATGAVGLSGAFAAFAADPSSPPTAAPQVAAPALACAGEHPNAIRHSGWHAARRGHRMARLMNRLNFTDAQRAQVRHLHAQAMVDVWTARADGTLTVDQLHARIRAAFKAQHDGFRSLLTDEQRAQLDQTAKPSVGHS
jgi:Spy/CpxP family protein refolding chaperone